MYIALVSIYVIVCVFLILVVLLQQGKGADIAGAFGGGGSQTAFGARGATTFLHKLTTVAFVGFVILSMLLSIIEARPRSSVMKTLPGAPAQKAPSAPIPPGQPVPGTGAPGPSTQPGTAPSAQGSAPAQPAPATSTQGSSQPNPKP